MNNDVYVSYVKDSIKDEYMKKVLGLESEFKLYYNVIKTELSKKSDLKTENS